MLKPVAIESLLNANTNMLVRIAFENSHCYVRVVVLHTDIRNIIRNMQNSWQTIEVQQLNEKVVN